MKKLLASLLVITVLVSFTLPASAYEQHANKTTKVLPNGDYIVTELTVLQTDQQTRSTKSGNKTSTYYNAFGMKMWDVTVLGEFTYTYGVSSYATRSSAVVNIYNTSVSYVSKSAWTSGNTATASGTVSFSGVQKSMNVSISCDIYGNLA